jgi:hypothetical protein
MQPVDGAFDKIGGVSSRSAGKTQEASRQPAEVVKCNHVKNQVSMEIAHPQAAHLQASQAFWGRQDQLTADVGQAGTMQAFLHLFLRITTVGFTVACVGGGSSASRHKLWTSVA